MPAASRATMAPSSGGPHAHCEVTELFAMLGRPHMLAILAAFRGAHGRPLRFSTLQGSLGLSPRTLAVRLRVLVAAGLLERRSFREIPPRVEYLATPKTADLDELFAVLGAWATRHSLRPGLGSSAPSTGGAGPAPSVP